MSSDSVEEITNWNDLNIKENLLRGIFSFGFENPSPIQKRAIKPIIEKNDVIAQAQSGTGKTGAFTISSIEVVDETVQETQALIMAPTRELAIQIIGVLDKMSTFIDGLKTKLLIGGTPMDKDIADIEKKPQIIVGTPGRVHDMLRRRKINTKFIKLLILDEADEMLSAGFKEQIYNIFNFLGNDVQVGLFSATLPVEIQAITEKFMRDPVKILVKTESITLEGIKQYYIALEDDSQKYETIKDIFESISLSQCIIYCNSIKRVNDLNEALIKDGFPVCCIHSGMEKDERMNAYKEFSNGGARVLISSNLTARGIDVQQVSTVINFDVPKDVHTYIHRIGRSGRWGRKGMGINFITRRDIRLIRDIEQYYDTQIEEMPAQISSP
jgi:translation initiation factor 4A